MADHDNTPRTIQAALATVLATMQEIPKDELPAFLGDLEQIRCLAMARLMSAPAAPLEPEQLIDVAEAARRLFQSKDWVYDNWKELGGIKLGSNLRFLPSGIDHYIRQQKGLTARRQRPTLQLRRSL